MASIAVGMCPSAAASPRSSPTVAGAVSSASVSGLASKAGQRPEMTDGFVLTDVSPFVRRSRAHFQADSGHAKVQVRGQSSRG